MSNLGHNYIPSIYPFRDHGQLVFITNRKCLDTMAVQCATQALLVLAGPWVLSHHNMHYSMQEASFYKTTIHSTLLQDHEIQATSLLECIQLH